MSVDHRIVEIETQRNFLGARCAQLADQVGELEAALATVRAENASLKAKLETNRTVFIDGDEGAD